MPPEQNSEERTQLQSSLNRIEAYAAASASSADNNRESIHEQDLRLAVLEERDKSWLAKLVPFLATGVIAAIPAFVTWGKVANQLEHLEAAVLKVEADANTGSPKHDRWIAEHEAKSSLINSSQDKVNSEAIESRRRLWDVLRGHDHK